LLKAAPPPPPRQPAPSYPPQGQPQGQYAQPHPGYGHQSYGKPYKKRKSWLEDIFD